MPETDIENYIDEPPEVHPEDTVRFKLGMCAVCLAAAVVMILFGWPT